MESEKEKGVTGGTVIALRKNARHEPSENSLTNTFQQVDDDPIAVFRNGRVIGKVRQWRCGVFEAVSASGSCLGCWNSAHSAAIALLSHASQGQA